MEKQPCCVLHPERTKTSVMSEVHQKRSTGVVSRCRTNALASCVPRAGAAGAACDRPGDVVPAAHASKECPGAGGAPGMYTTANSAIKSTGVTSEDGKVGQKGPAVIVDGPGFRRRTYVRPAVQSAASCEPRSSMQCADCCSRSLLASKQECSHTRSLPSSAQGSSSNVSACKAKDIGTCDASEEEPDHETGQSAGGNGQGTLPGGLRGVWSGGLCVDVSSATTAVLPTSLGGTSTAHVEERTPPTLEHLQPELHPYPEKFLRMINPVMVNGSGRRCLASAEEPAEFVDANTKECWRHAMIEELGSIMTIIHGSLWIFPTMKRIWSSSGNSRSRKMLKGA